MVARMDMPAKRIARMNAQERIRQVRRAKMRSIAINGHIHLLVPDLRRRMRQEDVNADRDFLEFLAKLSRPISSNAQHPLMYGTQGVP